MIFVKRRIFILGILVLIIQFGSAQNLSNLKVLCISKEQSPLVLDSLSLAPGSLLFLNGKDTLNQALFDIDYIRSEITWSPAAIVHDSICVTFRSLAFDFDLGGGLSLKKNRPDSLSPDEIERLVYVPGYETRQVIDFGGFERSGSLSRGISFGNNQNVVLNSGLNLQLSGNISEDVELSAFVTDRNLPFQPDGQTQNIQDFDRIFIQLKTKTNRVIVGDYDLNSSTFGGEMLRYNRNVKGARFDNTIQREKYKLRQSVSASVARGKFSRMTFAGAEGNQGPYRLLGANGENFIIVLAGSETVYFDGERLERGEQYDYTINYNAAELTFTPNRIVTNQSRIIIEFEYANQAYSRTLLTYSAEVESDKTNATIKVYSQQDAKNQSLQQDLTDTQKQFLRTTNGLNDLLFPGQDSSTFVESSILYAQIDSAGFRFFRHSSDTSKQLFTVLFSFVGEGKGSYNQTATSANGRVFTHILPTINGSDTTYLGKYVPFTRLIAPVRQQMISIDLKQKIGKNWMLYSETAFSSNNTNLFSGLSEDQITGIGAKLNLESSYPLGGKEGKAALKTNLRYEGLTKNFRAIQPYRNAEFARDWNLEEIYTENSEQIFGADLSFLGKKGVNSISYHFDKMIFRANNHEGIKNGLALNYSSKNISLSALANMTDFKNNSFKAKYNRGNANLKYKLGSLGFSIGTNIEDNRLRSGLNDMINQASFRFNIYKAGIFLNREGAPTFSFDYILREDFRVDSSSLKLKERGETFTLSSAFLNGKNHRFSANASYRKLNLEDFADQKRNLEENILAQIEVSGSFLSKMLRYNLFLNYGKGRELLRDFAFVEVPTGQGNFQWQDSNGDSTIQINEFIPAIFADSARYIKVFVPGNEFVATFQTKYGQNINLDPRRILKDKEGFFPKWISKFSAQSAFSVDRKSTNENFSRNINPFNSINDDELVFSNSQWRNSIFFNRIDPRFGFDLNSIRQLTKSLSTNGFNGRELMEQNVKFRSNLTRILNLEMAIKNGTRINFNESFEVNNYELEYTEFKPVVNLSIKKQLRLSFNYSLTIKENILALEIEESRINKLGTELTYNLQEKGILKFSLAQLTINYEGRQNTPASIEMLEGLRPGSNQVWNLSFLRSFANNLQLNLSYDGRKAQDLPIVHIGRVQARILF